MIKPPHNDERPFAAWGNPRMTKALVRFAEAGGRQAVGDGNADMAAELAALRAIVDELDYGIVVLDEARRVQFINRAFRRFWRVPDEMAESRQTFVRLMYHGRGTSPYAVSQDRLGDYVAKQLELIRTGEERPLNIRLSNGEVVQFRCKALPNGGRLLTYGNVSELAEQAEALERLASVDGLTGLNNRRHFLELAENEWSRFRRYGRPLAVLMIDIDLFKSVNDQYGHDVGDEVIKTVAGALQKHKRASDIVGRLGGEEFALILARSDARQRGGRRRTNAAVGCRSRISSSAASRISVTISIGVSVCRADTSGIDETAERGRHRPLRGQALRPQPRLPVWRCKCRDQSAEQAEQP